MKRSISYPTVVLLILALVATACGQTPGAPAPPSAPSANQAPVGAGKGEGGIAVSGTGAKPEAPSKASRPPSEQAPVTAHRPGNGVAAGGNEKNEAPEAAIQAPAPAPFVPAPGSGPGYATGPLNMNITAAALILDRVGAVKAAGDQLEVKDRQYEANGSFAVTINGAMYNVTSLKVISNLKLTNGAGDHQGTIDVDNDVLPGFHLTLDYRGAATMTGSTIVSKGTFKTGKVTGLFAGLVAEGSYDMTIMETAATLGAPATVTIATTSAAAAVAAPPKPPPAVAVAPGQPAAPPAPFVPAPGSGPGYATGPLNMNIMAAALILDRVGAVKAAANQLEVKDRQYEANGSFAVTINGAMYNVTSLKVISNLKLTNGAGDHQGTIDVDNDVLPGFHLTLDYRGAATMTGSTIVSKGTFKTGKVTGLFAGLVAEGSYDMTIMETAATLGAPATVTIATTSAAAAVAAPPKPPPAVAVAPGQPAAPPAPFVPAPGSGPGYATGPLNMNIMAAALILDRVGAVKAAANQLEVKDRQYEANGSFAVTINGAMYNVTSLKVISNLKLTNGAGDHQGTIDVDNDVLPGFHLTLEYRGVATMTGSTIVSKGTFKTGKATGLFAGLVAEGSYDLTIMETAATLGAPATVTITTRSP